MNKKNETILKVSLLPLVVLIALILGAGYFLLQDEIKLPKFNKGPQIRRLEGFPTLVYVDEEMDKKRIVIKSEEELNEFLNYVDSAGLVELKEKINFEKEYLLAASSTTNETTGYKMKIKKVYENAEEDKYMVILEETEPGETCTEDSDMNITVDIVAISKVDKQIDFDRVKKVVECD